MMTTSDKDMMLDEIILTIEQLKEARPCPAPSGPQKSERSELFLVGVGPCQLTDGDRLMVGSLGPEPDFIQQSFSGLQ
jgi:hypothetical protein